MSRAPLASGTFRDLGSVERAARRWAAAAAACRVHDVVVLCTPVEGGGFRATMLLRQTINRSGEHVFMPDPVGAGRVRLVTPHGSRDLEVSRA